MRNPIVDFVICTRNNQAIISATLEGIARQTVRDFTCTLVDGRSTDGTPELVRERFPWVEVVVKDQDTGPANSRSLGISRGSAKFIVLTDSDVILDPRWTEVQIGLMNSEPSVGIACGKLLYADAPEILNASYGAMNRYGVAWDGERGQPSNRSTGLRRCLWANTTVLAVRREMVERIGYFDEDMYASHEDTDFGWRANLFGYHVLFNPAAVAAHLVHGGFTVHSLGRRLIYLVWRNRLRSTLVNYELGSLLRYTSVYLSLAVLDGLVYGPRKEKIGALWWNLTHLAGTLRRRRWVQSHRRVRDKELWPMFESGFRGPGHGVLLRCPKGSEPGTGNAPAAGLPDCKEGSTDVEMR